MILHQGNKLKRDLLVLSLYHRVSENHQASFISFKSEMRLHIHHTEQSPLKLYEHLE